MLGLINTVLAEVPAVGQAIGVDDSGYALLGGLISLGLVVIGAGLGIGIVGGHSAEAIARQPEAGGKIFTTMIIAASMIEGVALFGMVICLIAVLKSLP